MNFKSIFELICKYFLMGFRLIRLIGYTNGNSDDKIAKIPRDNPWYFFKTPEEVIDWINQGGMIGLTLSGLTAIDVDQDQYKINFIMDYIKQHSICPAIQKTKNGYHLLFKGEAVKSIPSLVCKLGVEVTVKTKESAYIVVEPSDGKKWIEGDFSNLPELPELFKELEDSKHDILTALDLNLNYLYRTGQINGNTDIDMAYFTYLIKLGLSDEEIHEHASIIYQREYNYSITQGMINRNRNKLAKGEPCYALTTLIKGRPSLEKFVNKFLITKADDQTMIKKSEQTLISTIINNAAYYDVDRIVCMADEFEKMSDNFKNIYPELPTFERTMSGLRGLTVLGGEPKVGKSSFLQNWARHLCKEYIVLYFDFEMGWRVVLMRWKNYCITYGIDFRDFIQNHLLNRFYHFSKKDCLEVFSAKLSSKEYISILEELISEIRKRTGEEKIVIFIDSIQRLPDIPNKDKRLSMDAWMGELDSLVDSENNLAIITTSELSREHKQFKESGSIEYIADNLFLLYVDNNTIDSRNLIFELKASRNYENFKIPIFKESTLGFKELTDNDLYSIKKLI